MKAAIYIMVSDDKESNQHRLKLLVERVKSEGRQYKIFPEIADKKGTQPLKKDLLSRIYKNEFDAVLVSRMRDWSDSLLRLSSELNELNSKGIRFISFNENFDSFSLTGKLYLQFLLTVTECEQSFDSVTKENDTNSVKSVDHHFPCYTKTGRKTTEERSVELYDFQGKIPSDDNDCSKDFIPGMNSRIGKNSTKTNNFDLVGLSEACLLTGYSKHTIYQLTSRKLIPHFKRPHGRRIFFSKHALEQWIITGKT
jgi:excisionase family DNA binding protein